jgi:hypothetical protein
MQNENESTSEAGETAASAPLVFMRPRRVQCRTAVDPHSVNVDSNPASQKRRCPRLRRVAKRVLRHAKRQAATR